MAIKSQYDQRRFQKYTDQHGRAWTAWIETRSGAPCTPVTPSFASPIVPPQTYIRLVPDEPGKVFIDYPRWIAELRQADKEWQRRCHEVGIQLYKDQFNPAEPFNVAVLNQVGARPHIPAALTPLRALPLPGAAALPVLACQQGHPWALGLKGPNGEEPKRPPELDGFFVRVEDTMPIFATEFEMPPATVVPVPAASAPAHATKTSGAGWRIDPEPATR